MSKENFQNPPVIPRPPFPPDGVMPRYYPYHPEWPAGYWGWNDTEPASVGPWGCCPPHPIDDCICVTSADIDRWNSMSALSALSGIDLNVLSGISGMNLPYSATLWNSCYETVYSNSATWESAQYIPEMSAWTSAAFDTLTKDIWELSSHRNEVWTDKTDAPYYIEGTGAEETPLALSHYVVDLLKYIDTGVSAVPTKEDVKNGLPTAPKVDWIATRKEYNTLQKSYEQLLGECRTQQASIKELWDTIKLIIQLIQGTQDAEIKEGIDKIVQYLDGKYAYWNKYWNTPGT